MGWGWGLEGGPRGRVYTYHFSSVQLLSHVRLFATPWIAARQASMSINNSWSSLRLTFIEAVMPSSHLILCHPLLLLPPIPPSIKAFTVSQLFTWGDQSTGISALASFFPKKSQGWFPSDSSKMLNIKIFYFIPFPIGLKLMQLMLLNCGVGEDSGESLGLQGDPTSPFWGRSALEFLWKEWC